MDDFALDNPIKQLPKIELHRHWEASMRLETLVDIARDAGIEMPEYNVDNLRPFVQIMPDEPNDMLHFLGKFATLRQFYRSLDIIERITTEIIHDAADDNVQYMELRFTPKALVNLTRVPISQVVKLICETTQRVADEAGIIVRLIASMNRHEEVEIGEQVLRAAVDHMHQGIVGIDLAGNEEYPALPFYDIFREAKEEGLGITIHAGEWNGASSVWDAVGSLGADRIGHGVRVLEDVGITNILVEREITLEVCPTSNVYSGVIPSLAEHPLPQLMEAGIKTTINTDDPLICDINLTDELTRVMQHMNLSIHDIQDSILQSAKSAFLPAHQRQNLIQQFEHQFANYSPNTPTEV